MREREMRRNVASVGEKAMTTLPYFVNEETALPNTT